MMTSLHLRLVATLLLVTAAYVIQPVLSQGKCLGIRIPLMVMLGFEEKSQKYFDQQNLESLCNARNIKCCSKNSAFLVEMKV